LERSLAASALMVVPAYGIVRLVPLLYGGPGGRLVALLFAGVAGLVTFVALLRAWRSPELDALRGGFGHMLARPGP
jgi:hypothetical protein